MYLWQIKYRLIFIEIFFSNDIYKFYYIQTLRNILLLFYYNIILLRNISIPIKITKFIMLFLINYR